jgi:hypothetical protein
MAVTSLAMAAAAAFSTAIAGQLGGDVVAGFKSLVRRRFSGDRRAESALAAVEWNPNDPGARQMLAQALAYYAADDPAFRQGLGETVNYMQYYIDQSHSASWRVGRDNYGSISTPITDNRIYQTGQYVGGRDVWVDNSRMQMDFDQMSSIRNASGIPKAIMVIGMLIAFAGFIVFASGLYWFATTAISGGLDSSGPAPPPVLAPIVQRCAFGFGMAFVGIVLSSIGGVFRSKGR